MSEFISDAIDFLNTYQYVKVGFSSIIFFWAFLLIKNIVLARLRILSQKTKSRADDLLIALVDGVRWPFYLCLSLIVNLNVYELNIDEGFVDTYNRYVNILYILTGIVFAYYTISSFKKFLFYLIEKSSKGSFSRTQLSFFGSITDAVLWSVVIVVIAQNLGLDLSALVTGLGIGGIAIAFALQNILGDLFASISIYLDKPFEIGDPIDIGGTVGTVQKIGLKTTRIKTLQGEELIVNNRDLTEARVRNYQRMNSRRVEFNFGIDYNSDYNSVKALPEIITKIIDAQELAKTDRIHLAGFGDSALEYNIVYIISSPDFEVYREVHQSILFGILEETQKLNISIPYPTQTLHLKNMSQ